MGLSRATRAVVAEGGERALPEGSFDGPQLPGCPDQAGFGYHTSPTLQRTLTRCPQHHLSARLITEIIALPSSLSARSRGRTGSRFDGQNRASQWPSHDACAALNLAT